MRTGHQGQTVAWAVLAILALIIVIPNNALISSNDRVGLALDWQEIQGVAQAAGVSAEQLAETLQPEGAKYLVVREDTLGRLKQTGRIQVLNGWELYQLNQMMSSELGQQTLADPDFRFQDTHILVGSRELFQRLNQRLAMRFPDKVRVLATQGDNTYGLAIQVPWDQLTSVGIGVSLQEIDAVRALGYEPVLEWLDSLKTKEEMALDQNDLVQVRPAVLMPGPVPFSNSERVGTVLAQLGILQGVPEFELPTGAAQVAAASGYKTVRVYERPVHTIYQEYLLAARDRNVRLVILHLLWQVPAGQEGVQSLVNANRMHLSRTAAALEAAGMTLGAPMAFLPRETSRWLLAGLLGLLPIAFLDLRRWPKTAQIILCLGLAMAAIVVSTEALTWLRKGAALAVAGLVPVKAIRTAVKTRDQEHVLGPGLKQGLLALFQAGAVTLLGGVVVQGLLGDIVFLLKLDAFSGIKAAYMITFVLVLAHAYWEQWSGPYWWRQKQIAPIELMALFLLAVAVLVLFNRSGNTSVIPIPEWELAARNFLETVLFVRPRTKEFLVGHPALMLVAAGCGKDKFYRPYLLVLAAVGQASLMNTFVHLHTPFVISLARSLLGLAGGALVGAFLLGIRHFMIGRGKQNA